MKKKTESVSITTEVLRVLEESTSHKEKPPETIYDVIRSLDTNPKERRTAARILAGSVLPTLIEKAIGYEDGSYTGVPNLPAADVALKYLKFVIELDGKIDEDIHDADPVDLLSKLTGLSRDDIISLYHRSSRTKFIEITRKNNNLDSIDHDVEEND